MGLPIWPRCFVPTLPQPLDAKPAGAMSDPLVRIHVNPPGASIILNRPDSCTLALTRAMIAELSQAA